MILHVVVSQRWNKVQKPYRSCRYQSVSKTLDMSELSLFLLDNRLTGNEKINRQLQTKQGALSQLAFKIDITAHGPRQEPRGCQAQAMAVAGHAGIGVDLFISLEDQFVMGFCDAGAVVAHRQGEKIVVASQVNEHHPAPIRQGILE